MQLVTMAESGNTDLPDDSMAACMSSTTNLFSQVLIFSSKVLAMQLWV